jgi:subtilisin family serine protease
MPRLTRKPSFIVLLCLLVTLADQAGAQERAIAPSPPLSIPGEPDGSTDAPPAYMPDRVLVKLKPASAGQARLHSGTTSSNALLRIASVDAVSARVGAVRALPAIESPRNSSLASELGLDRWVRIELVPGADVVAAVAAYGADPNVEVAEPEYIFQPLVTPTDPIYPVHWGHNNTKQFRAFNPSTGSHSGAFVGTLGFDANAEAGWTGPHGFGRSSVIIAILDTGVDLTHPDLTVVAGYDTGEGDSDPQDNSVTPGHGTACAGVAAARANNDRGSCGSAPGCSIMPMKVTNDLGFFSFFFIANAIVWATDHGADFLSMSFGFYFPPEEASALVNGAIEYADAAGVVMFSGTGNANNGLMLYPASHPKVISVGAASPCVGRKRSSSNPAFLSPGVSPDPNNISCDGVRWWGSSWGSDTQDAADAVDILGPTLLTFTDIQGPAGYSFGDYGSYFNGVSCSVPYVAGVAALIKSKHPDWTAAQIRQQLLRTAQDVVNVESVAGWDRYSGYGMVDIDAAAGCSAAPLIVGNGGITVDCGALIRPADLLASVSDPDGDEDVVRVAITRVDDTDMDVDSTLVSGAGTHPVRVTVTDYCGNTASVSVDVTVSDTTPPSLAVVMDRSALWPPNRRLVPVCAAITATDDCDADPDVALVSVVSSEPDDGHAGGDIDGADLGADDRCFELRAERTGEASTPSCTRRAMRPATSRTTP